MKSTNLLIVLLAFTAFALFACDDSGDADDSGVDACESELDCASATDCRAFYGRRVYPDDACSGPLQQAACQSDASSYPTTEDGQTCLVDPQGQCWCDMGFILNGWRVAEAGDACEGLQSDDIPLSAQCGDGLCQGLTTQTACDGGDGGAQCIWKGGFRLNATDSCKAPGGVCYPNSDQPSQWVLGILAVAPDGACWLFDGTDYPPSFITCDNNVEPQSEANDACENCLELADQADTDDWPECE